MSTERPDSPRRVELGTVGAVIIILVTNLVLLAVPHLTWVLVDVTIALVCTAGLAIPVTASLAAIDRAWIVSAQPHWLRS